MANISLTLTTSDEQDKALAWMLDTLNADPRVRPATAKPFADVSEMLTFLFTDCLGTYHADYCQAQRSCLTDAFAQASPEDLAAIAKVLKVTLPGTT
jgi:hypothetical protein